MSSVRVSAFEIVPANYFAPLILGDYFAGEAPLEVDVGCGDGAFLIAMAQRSPERNFLGIERLVERVAKAGRRAERLGLKNVRLLAVESAYAVRYLLPPESVKVFHVAFPDPWPKRKHWSRRLVQVDFLAAVHAALTVDGELRVKTDDANYFQHMRAVFAAQTSLREIEWSLEPGYPITTFESHFLAQELPIYRARLVKN
jgi:tRNA (guanine-N7-)-methyltransferase